VARRRRRRRRRWRGALRRALLFAALAGLALPAAAVGLLRVVAPPTTAFMVRSRFADPATGRACARVQHRWTAFEAISPDLALAVVVAEDQRFLEHHGFDWRSLRRAVRERRRAGRVRGASTISQQVAKNLFLWPEASWIRKGIEAWLTLWIEALWPKRRILEVYLNVAQFGPCVFGAAAASRRYFDVAPAALSADQAALLAAVLPNPHRLRAYDPGPYARERAAQIRALMDRHERLRRRL
jgi:monofunctional biosynthetic peptidoglycan transglycosylase